MHLAALLLAAAAALPELSPGTRYDTAIPTLEQVVGHDFGEEVSSPEEIVAYLKALAAAAPDRTRLVKYADSWEGRPLYYLAVAAPERIARLDAIKADLRRIADPRALSAAEAERLIKELPAVCWLVHGVHGNEISSGGAAMAEAYHLLAARGDATVDLILREAIVLIDPAENPDGRARFVFQNRLGRAATPDVEPLAAEHDEPWPGGRSNHYLFDLNRDWFALSQPESRGRVAVHLEWQPHVVVDLHEMGADSTYYFPPPAPPANPHRTTKQTEWLETFGRANAARFDARGYGYFIREVFDSFYPGYGASWPMAQGAIAQTFEQASARGLAVRRRDDTVLTYYAGILHHFTAALSTAETTARHRERLLRDFALFRRAAVQDGERGPVRAYLLPPGPDAARSTRLAKLLTAQGVEVTRAEEPIALATRSLPAGTYAVSLAQPAGRLARNLLDAQAPMDAAFLAEQDRRRARRLPDQIYDITAWSLPLLWDVESIASERPVTARLTPVVAAASSSARAARALPAAKVGYLMPWGSGTAAAVAEALAAGLRVRTADQAFTLGGRKYGGGAALLRSSENGAELPAKLADIAARHDAEVIGTDSGWVDDGISLGSNQVVPLKTPRVLLAWDTPTQSLSAGWARYVLERRFGLAVSAVRVSSFRRLDWRRYDVLVLPSGDYGEALGEDGLRRLKDWIRGGGTLVTLAEASRWAAREKVALLDARTELKDGRPETDAPPEKKDAAPPKPDAPKPAFDFDKAIQPERERPELTPGALLRVTLDTDHWLSAGHDGEIQAMVEGQRIFSPIRLDKGRNVGVYAAKDKLLASGIVWPEAREQLPHKAFLIHQPSGEGHVIAFAEDPNFRAFAEATALLFANAVILGPAH